MRSLTYSFLSILFLMFAIRTQGQEFKRFAIDLNGGATYPATDIVGNFGAGGNIGIRYNMTNLIGLGGEFEMGQLTSGNDQYSRKFQNNFFRYSFMGYFNIGRLMHMEQWISGLNLQYLMGVGRVHTSVSNLVYPGGVEYKPYKTQDLTYNFGGRLQIKLSQSFAINLSGTYNMSNSDWLDGYNKRIYGNKFNDRYITAMAGVSIYLGKSGVDHGDWVDVSQTKDLEKKVGSSQKSIKKMHDNMEDADGDGVIDMIDQDNATPEGVRVDTRGVPLDTDYDRIPDYLDDCPVEAGTDENNGCPGIARDTAGAGTPMDTGKVAQPGEEPGRKPAKERYTKEEVKEYPVVSFESTRNANPQKDVFYIIAGSFSEKINAIDFNDYLKSEGYNAQILYVKKKNLFRVAVSRYGDEAKAREMLKEFRRKYNSSAWLLMQ